MCVVSLLFSALYAKCPCYLPTHDPRWQSAAPGGLLPAGGAYIEYHGLGPVYYIFLIIQCFICNVSFLVSALYAKCHSYLVLYMLSVLLV